MVLIPAFIDSEPLWKYTYGEFHPLKMYRLRLTQTLLAEVGILDKFELIKLEPAPQQVVLTFHTSEYLEALRQANSGVWTPALSKYGLGTGDCPVQEGIWEASLLAAGGSWLASREILAGRARSLHIGGGLHHAMPARASGFCYINDPVIAINCLKERFERIVYLDIDGHHGDGVEYAYREDPSVLTISTHESGHFLYPGTGFETDMGTGKGRGFALNIPFLPGAGDDAYTIALEEVVFPAIHNFKPQVVVSQLGMDALNGDPLTHWRLTTHSIIKVLQFLDELDLPWVALGGGGYNIANVVRGWTLTACIIAGISPPDELPPTLRWHQLASHYGVSLTRLHDSQPTTSPAHVIEDIRRVVSWLKKHHPLLAP